MATTTGEGTTDAAAAPSTATDNMIDPSRLSVQQLQGVYQQLQKVREDLSVLMCSYSLGWGSCDWVLFERRACPLLSCV